MAAEPIKDGHNHLPGSATAQTAWGGGFILHRDNDVAWLGAFRHLQVSTHAGEQKGSTYAMHESLLSLLTGQPWSFDSNAAQPVQISFNENGTGEVRLPGTHRHDWH